MEARYILELNAKWKNTDKNIIADNVEEILTKNGFNSFSSKLDKLTEVTESSKHAVYAWLNHGRSNVKIPFLKLCMIADVFNVSMKDLLKGGE